MTERLYLVSCVAGKRQCPAPAGDLYRSTWFVLARGRIEREGAPWYILSAKYGLVHPQTVVSPYDETLNTMRIAERRNWASRVRLQMEL